MNYKLEKFWNACIDTGGHHTQKWTINLKSFEIIYKNGGYMKVKFMNCKLEKFWNNEQLTVLEIYIEMNCKLEKFWNMLLQNFSKHPFYMNCKLEKFWNKVISEKIP